MILNLIEDNTSENSRNPLLFKFKTNARKFKINYQVSKLIKGNFSHLGVTARKGILVLFKRYEDKNWTIIDAYSDTENELIDMSNLVNKNEEYNVLIYGPILSTLSTLSVELFNDDTGEICNDTSDTKITVLGGPHSFGLGCTTVGSMFSNILERKLDVSVNHITYRKSNYLGDIYNKLKNNSITKSDIIILEVDYIRQDTGYLKKYLHDIVEMLKKQCSTLICWYCIPESKIYKKALIQEFLHGLVDDDNIFLKDFSWIYNGEYGDMCTYSDYFINDTGNIIIYKELSEIIMGALK